MKTIEQKALAYDEALEKAKAIYHQGGYKPDTAATIAEILQNVFPELKESEDEKIREALIRFHKSTIDIDGIKGTEIVAWLEKLKVFSEHGDGLYYFGNNGFTYVGNPTCDNVSWIEKQGEKETLCDKCKKEHPSHSCQDITALGRCAVEHERNPAWLEKQESVEEIVARCKDSWYNEGKIQGQIEGLSDEEKYQQGWHDALEKQGSQDNAEV